MKKKMNNSLTENSHRFTDKDLPLYLMAGGFGMWRAWRRAGLDKATATYDVFIRELPKSRNFFVFTGLEEVITDLLKWKFSESDIATLLKYDVVDEEMAEELKDFKFDITIEAMSEGSICFPNEPLLKFTGPLYKLELLYLYVVNAISSNTVFSSKCMRVVLAAKGRTFVMPTTRAHGFESCFKCMRGMYICGGTPSSSQLAFWNKYDIQPQHAFIASTHAFIKSFDSEEEAMEIYGDTFKDSEVPVLVDTYNFERGLDRFIDVCHRLKIKNGRVSLMVYIDSGDLSERAKYTRTKLNENGLQEVKILLSGNLDEYKVEKLVQDDVPADLLLGITEIVNSADAPILEVVHKLAELSTSSGTRQAMKLTEGKKSYPGRKQVFRIKDENGVWIKDIIGIEDEQIEGEYLLQKYVENGSQIKELPSLSEIRSYTATQIASMPENLKNLGREEYPVELSNKLNNLINNFKHS